MFSTILSVDAEAGTSESENNLAQATGMSADRQLGKKTVHPLLPASDCKVRESAAVDNKGVVGCDTNATMARILEQEENWLRHRLRRMRAMLRYANEPRVEAGLRELIADAEDRLDALETHRRTRPLRGAAGSESR